MVVSIGGSTLLTGAEDAEYVSGLADLLKTAGERGPLVVTTGGGRIARTYIELGRALGLTEVELDEFGIEVTRLNARFLASRIGPPCPAHPPTTVAEAVLEVHRASPVVMGGTEPGHTTDAVASLVAVRLRAARLINATDVDGVYDRDPHLDPTAVRIDRMSWGEFRGMVERNTTLEAGQSFVFDRLGADLLARAGIPLSIVKGRDLANLAAALEGRPFRGSRIGELRPAGRPAKS